MSRTSGLARRTRYLISSAGAPRPVLSPRERETALPCSRPPSPSRRATAVRSLPPSLPRLAVEGRSAEKTRARRASYPQCGGADRLGASTIQPSIQPVDFRWRSLPRDWLEPLPFPRLRRGVDCGTGMVCRCMASSIVSSRSFSSAALRTWGRQNLHHPLNLMLARGREGGGDRLDFSLVVLDRSCPQSVPGLSEICSWYIRFCTRRVRRTEGSYLDSTQRCLQMRAKRRDRSHATGFVLDSAGACPTAPAVTWMLYREPVRVEQGSQSDAAKAVMMELCVSVDGLFCAISATRFSEIVITSPSPNLRHLALHRNLVLTAQGMAANFLSHVPQEWGTSPHDFQRTRCRREVNQSRASGVGTSEYGFQRTTRNTDVHLSK